MNKLIKKILTSKAHRNLETLSKFMLTLVVIGAPWQN